MGNRSGLKQKIIGRYTIAIIFLIGAWIVALAVCFGIDLFIGFTSDSPGSGAGILTFMFVFISAGSICEPWFSMLFSGEEDVYLILLYASVTYLFNAILFSLFLTLVPLEKFRT